MQDLNECAAVRPIGNPPQVFVPLTSEEGKHNSGAAVFAFMFRRHDIPVSDCWAVITKSDDAALALLTAIKQAHQSRAGWAAHGDRPAPLVTNKQAAGASMSMSEDWDGAVIKESFLAGNNLAASDLYEKPPLKGFFYAPRADLIKQYSVAPTDCCNPQRAQQPVVLIPGPAPLPVPAAQPAIAAAQRVVPSQPPAPVPAPVAKPTNAAAQGVIPPQVTNVPAPLLSNGSHDIQMMGFPGQEAARYYPAEYPGQLFTHYPDGQPVAFVVPEACQQVGATRVQGWPSQMREYLIDEDNQYAADCGCNHRGSNHHKKKKKKKEKRNKPKDDDEHVMRIVPESTPIVRHPLSELDDQPFEQYLPDHLSAAPANYLRPVTDRQRYESHISPGTGVVGPYGDEGPYECHLPSPAATTGLHAAASANDGLNHNFILRPRDDCYIYR
jgi:hypothetical protein